MTQPAPPLDDAAAVFAAIRSLSPRQRDVLGAIAINFDGGHHPRTLAVLEAKGLIVGEVGTLPPRPGDPAWTAVRVRRYYVPLPIHVVWCAWCAEQPDAERT